jgi:hypothetical protein
MISNRVERSETSASAENLRNAPKNFHIFRNNLLNLMRTFARVKAIASVIRALSVALSGDCGTATFWISNCWSQTCGLPRQANRLRPRTVTSGYSQDSRVARPPSASLIPCARQSRPKCVVYLSVRRIDRERIGQRQAPSLPGCDPYCCVSVLAGRIRVAEQRFAHTML